MAHLVTTAVLVVACHQLVNGIALEEFYPFGDTTADSFLPPNRDGSSIALSLTMPFPVFEEDHMSIYVNENGIISFTASVSQFTPDPFPLSENFTLIAPFWADVDTRGIGTVWHREANDPQLLARARDEIQAAFVDQSSFVPTQLFIATWDHVGYFNNHTDRTNTFQCVLMTNGMTSFVSFLYADGEIQWTTGDASGGSGGMGGISALAGFNAGDGIRFSTIPGSLSDDIINVTDTSNVGIPGVWMFQINIPTEGCSFDPQVMLALSPRGGHFLGGTVVEVSGPCLDESDNITCVFGGQEIEGVFVNAMVAFCLSPPLMTIGHLPFQLVVRSAGGSIRSQGSAEFISLSFDEGFRVQLNASNLVFVPETVLRITWLPETIVPVVDPGSYTVAIRLYCFNNESDTFEEVATIASNILNSGQADVILPALNISDVCPLSIQVSLSGETTALTRRQISGTAVQRLIQIGELVIPAGARAVIALLTGGFGASLTLRGLCELWCLTQPAGIGAALLAAVLPCPPTLTMALCDPRFALENVLVSRTFHPGTDRCFREIVPPGVGCSPGSQCCYGFNGALVCGPPGGGTIDMVSPQGGVACVLQHFLVDVLPAIYCCTGLFPDCASYYAKRPSTKSIGYAKPPPPTPPTPTPTDSTEPTEPTPNPTPINDPTEPIPDPTPTNDPTEPTEPTEPTPEPTPTNDPTEPTDPTESTGPTEPTDPDPTNVTNTAPTMDPTEPSTITPGSNTTAGTTSSSEPTPTTETTDPNEGTMGGDPHFSIMLPDNNMLCYTVQGQRGSVFNLISDKNFHMNALFIPNPGERNATWIGSLGIVMWNNYSNVSKLKFEALSKQIYMGDGITIPAKSVSDLHFNNGELCMSIAHTRKHTHKPSVRVSLEDVGLFFTIKFTQKHLEMFWHRTGECNDNSHGLIGQFLRKDVKIDEDKRILILSNKSPVPVKQRQVWGYMKQEMTADSKLCWAVKSQGEQGEGLIDGTYMDYRVKDILSCDFKFKAKKHLIK